MADEEITPVSVWFAKDKQHVLDKVGKAAEADDRKLSPMIVKILEENVDKYLKR